MKQLKKVLLVLAASALLMSFFSCGSKGLNGWQKVNEDVTLSATLCSDIDLDGHTAKVPAGVSVIKNVCNGNLVIDENVSTVTIEQGLIDTLTVKGKTVVVIDGSSDITKIRMEGNGKITSTGHATRNKDIKKYKNGRAAVGEFEPEIGSLEVAPGVKATVEGGAFDKVVSEKKEETEGDIVITVDSTASFKEMEQVEDGQTLPKLKLQNDEAYDGNGVRIIVRDRRDGVQCMQVMKVKDGVWDQVGWFDNIWKDNPLSEQVDSDFYVYEYLNKDVEYTLVFNYYKYLWVDEKGNTSDDLILLNSDSITVTPTKGRELIIDKEDVALRVDGKKGKVTWGSLKPQVSNLFQNAKLVYQVFSKDDKERYLFIGQYEQNWSNLFEDIEFYKQFSLYNRNKIYNKTVYIITYLELDGNRFPLVDSNEFTFDNSIFPEVSVSDKNILKFDQKPDAKIIPDNADGFYIWLYSGDVGSYIAYNDKKDFKDIDLNIIIETNSDLKKAIKADNNNYSFDMSWFHKEVGENGQVDNKWIGTIAHEEDNTYVEQKDYAGAVVTLDGTKLKIKNAGSKITELYKDLGATKIGWDVFAGDEWLYSATEDSTAPGVLSGAIDAGAEYEYDVTKRLIVNADKVTAAGNSFKVSVWAKDADDNWLSQVCPELKGTFDASAYVKPAGEVTDDYVFEVTTAPSKAYIDFITKPVSEGGLGAAYYNVGIRVRDVKGKDEYFWNYNDRISFSDTTVDIKDYKYDLKVLLADNADVIKSKEGEFEVIFEYWSADENWEFLGEFQNAIKCTGYELKDEWKPLEITLTDGNLKINKGVKYMNEIIKDTNEETMWEITVRSKSPSEINDIYDKETDESKGIYSDAWSRYTLYNPISGLDDNACFETINLNECMDPNKTSTIDGKIYVEYMIRNFNNPQGNWWCDNTVDHFYKIVEFDWTN